MKTSFELEKNIMQSKAIEAEIAYRESLPMTKENMETILWLEAELAKTYPDLSHCKPRFIYGDVPVKQWGSFLLTRLKQTVIEIKET